MTTIRELAKKLELSPATVSMVLNSAPLSRYIPEATRKRVRDGAKKYGYFPNQFARSLRNNRSGTVGVLVSDVSDPYCSEVLRGITGAFFSTSYVPILINIDNSSRKFDAYVQVLLERRIDGVIAVSNSLLLKTDVLDVFRARGLPVVVIGRGEEFPGVSSVAVENEAGTFLAMKHLYRLGHRRLAIIKGPQEVIDSKHRWHGIARFAREHDLNIDKKLVVELKQSASSADAGLDATNALIETARPFTALVAFDDITAFGSIRALTLAGRSVPGDCSVCGFDNIAASQFSNPPLSTVDQRMVELGKKAVEEFIAVASQPQAERETSALHRLLGPKLVVRASTDAPHG